MSETELGSMSADETFEQHSDSASVSRQHIITHGDRDTEVVELSSTAGASSEAPASSGIPSAMRQSGLRGGTDAQDEHTDFADGIIHTDDPSQP